MDAEPVQPRRRTGRTPAAGPWVWWALSRAGCVLLLRTVRHYNGVSVEGDVRGVYFRAARMMFAGAVPYRDFHYEYPPGTLPVVALARLVSGDQVGRFTAVWVLLMIALDATVMASLLHIATGRDGVGRRWPAAAFWTVGGSAMFWILLHNDLVVVAPVVLALALTTSRPAAAGASWAFAVVTKIWPAPLLLGVALGRPQGRWRLVLGASVVLVATAIAVAVPGATRSMVSYLVHYQGHRPIEFESSWADLRWVRALCDGTTLHPHLIDGAPGLVGGDSAQFATLGYDLTTAVSILAVLAPLAIRWRSREPITLRFWVWLVAAYVLATLLVAPVFSAQYAVWVLGVGAAVLTVDLGRWAILTAGSCAAVCGLTAGLFPFGFLPLDREHTWAVLVLTLRTVAVAIALGLATVGALAAARGATTSRVRPAGAAAGSRRR